MVMKNLPLLALGGLALFALSRSGAPNYGVFDPGAPGGGQADFLENPPALGNTGNGGDSSFFGDRSRVEGGASVAADMSLGIPNTPVNRVVTTRNYRRAATPTAQGSNILGVAPVPVSFLTTTARYTGGSGGASSFFGNRNRTLGGATSSSGAPAPTSARPRYSGGSGGASSFIGNRSRTMSASRTTTSAPAPRSAPRPTTVRSETVRPRYSGGSGGSSSFFGNRNRFGG